LRTDIGIGPPETGVSDQDWILYSGKMLFIMRTARDKWKEGDCKGLARRESYVHGVMDRDAVHQDGEVQTVWV
jgi:hypothetical protein